MQLKIGLFSLSAALFFTGCSNPMSSLAPETSASKRIYEKPNISKEKRFHETMIKVAQSTKKDPLYHRMALKKEEEKVWFKDLMYRLWDRQITRKEFIAEGIKRYPQHRYEFTFIANAYQNY